MTDDLRDATLAGRGDAEAFTRLYRRHLPRVERLAAWLLGHDDIDDVIQEVFVRTWQKVSLFRGDSSFTTWLHRLSVNVIVRHRQRERERAANSTALDALESPRIATDTRIDLEAAVALLPKGAREVFVLHDITGHDHQEIATLLGIAPATSRVQLHRARTALRAHL